MWHIALMGSGLVTALVGAAVIDLAKPSEATAMHAQADVSDMSVASMKGSIARGSDGLFYARVHTTSGQVRLLVDTGASHVVLSHADARKLGTRLQRRQHSIIATAAGPVKADWVVIDRLDVQGHVLRNVEAAVPRNDVRTSLLGQNALAQFSAMRIERDHLTLVR